MVLELFQSGRTLNVSPQLRKRFGSKVYLWHWEALITVWWKITYRWCHVIAFHHEWIISMSLQQYFNCRIFIQSIFLFDLTSSHDVCLQHEGVEPKKMSVFSQKKKNQWQSLRFSGRLNKHRRKRNSVFTHHSLPTLFSYFHDILLEIVRSFWLKHLPSFAFILWGRLKLRVFICIENHIGFMRNLDFF